MHLIRMDHPAKNALGSDLVAWLGAELERAGDAPILLTGTGDAFCAGLDLKEVAAASAAELEVLLDALDRLCQRLYEHPAPTVAWVNGHAIAGGCVLVQCCDYRVAADGERVRIGLNEVALGACYPPRILRILRHRLPARWHHDVLLGAGLLAPPAALARGLLDEVSMDPEADARAWIERAARHPRRTFAHTKRLCTAGVADATAADLERFRREELPLWTSDEVRDRVRAVLAR
jgi:enoyl-CoA hydratase